LLYENSIDKWDQLKDQFTSNFTGAKGRSGTRMDLAYDAIRGKIKNNPGGSNNNNKD
jgi:hypothetical protein